MERGAGVEVLRRAILLLAAAVLSWPLPARAQLAVGADAGLYSDYVWRGLTYTNRLVLQPDAYLATAFGGTSASVGLWANIEPGRYDGATDISEGGGLAGPDLTEWNWWVELGRPLGRHRIAAGVTGYRYPNDARLTADLNTLELYAKTQFSLPFSPRLSGYWDVDTYGGFYLEGSLTQPVPVSRRFRLDAGVLAGVSAGLSGSGAARYASDGLTHIDLSLATAVPAGSLIIRPALHLQFSADEATKITRREDCGGAGCPFHRSDTKIWFGARISWYRPLNLR